MNTDVIIVGAGQAAAQLCLSLRAGGFQDRILMIGAERFAPYQRPPLSKKFLTERRPPDTLLLRPQTLWRDQGVELMLETQVVGLDLARRTVAIMDAQARSRELDYGTLVLATGTRARTLSAAGAALDGVFSLRSIDDVHRLRPALDAAGRIVIVGGGYIGLEVAAVMRQEDRQVMVLEAEDRLLKRVTGIDMSAFFEALHRERGVDIRLGARLAEVAGEGVVSGVRLADGTLVPADVVLLAIGAQANDDLGRAAGLACRDGFLVDACARTRCRESMPSGTAPGSRAAASAGTSVWRACRTPSIRPRRPPAPSWGRRGPMIRCPGSGPTSTRSSCRWPAFRTATTAPRWWASAPRHGFRWNTGHRAG